MRVQRDVISQHAPGVFLTLDLWSSRDMRSFMGITAHYIVEFELSTAMLACSRFCGSHTREAIYECYKEIIDEFQITSKILSTVTDSASNMIKAFSLHGYKSDSNTDDNEDVVEDVQPVLVNDKDSDSTAVFVDYESSFPRRIPCFTHMLQLVVSDGFK